MPVGIYGKHPAKGDFLDAGVPGPLLKLVEGWLDTALAEAREALGAEWEAVWSQAPLLRFWLGEGIWGAPLAGVLMASRDRVGRRFPLVLMATGADAPPPPVVDPAQGWHDPAEAHLRRVMALADFPANAALLEGAPVAPSPDQPGPADFWAVCPGQGVEALWSDVALTDHRRAAAGRSYWWVAGEPERSAEPWPEAIGEEATELPAAEVADPALPVEVALSEAVVGMEDASEPSETQLPDDETSEVEAEPVEAEVAAEFAGAALAELAAEDAVSAGEPDPWGLALPEDEGSPFDSAPLGFSLFAAPAEPVGAPPPEPAETAPAPAIRPRDPLWSQVWAGQGLPSGAVLAWFFRGHVGNG